MISTSLRQDIGPSSKGVEDLWRPGGPLSDGRAFPYSVYYVSMVNFNILLAWTIIIKTLSLTFAPESTGKLV